jgi:hypothetical protein
MIEAYIRTFCGHDMRDWEELLPLAEFAYNNSMSTATGVSPFYINYGYHPRSNWPKSQPVQNPTSTNYVHWLKAVHEECTQSLERTRQRMGKYYDQKRSEPAEALKEGDRVMLDGRFIKTKRPTKKFDHKYLGPFTISKVLSPTAYRLELPTRWRIHNVFHISLLEPYRTSSIMGCHQPAEEDVMDTTGDVEEPETSDDYEPAEIMHSELDKGEVLYLVRWKDFPEVKDWTWEPWSHVKGSPLLLKQYHQANAEKPRDKRMKIGRNARKR